MKAIEVKALTKRYGKVRGFEDLSFEVAEGEIFGYLCPNRTRISYIIFAWSPGTFSGF